MQAGEIVASLKLKIDDFRRGIDEAQKQVKDFEKRWENTSKSFKTVGTAMATIGTGIGFGLGSAVKTAADFESAMSRVGALSGATEKEMALLTKEARRLGATTSFSASQAAEGMQYLAMAGFNTTQIIEAMGGVLDMAAAGQIGLGDAANIATNIMSGFGLEASKASRVADVLTKTFTSSNTTLHGLGETMKYAAPAAKSVGWSLEEVAAAAGKLGDVGIDASMAGTALRAAVVRLASPTKEAKKIMEQFGIQIQDANGKIRPLYDILGQMKDKFKNLSDAEKAAAMQAIFGTEAMSAMLALMEDPKGLEQFTKELENAGGTAQEIAEKQLDNLNGAIEELGGAFEEVQISVGNALIPAIRTLAEWLTKLLNWFNGLPESVKSGIAIFLALSTVLLVVGGGLLLFIGFIPNIIAGFKALTTVFGALRIAITAVGKSFIWLLTNPIGWIILGIAALIAIIVLIVKHWDTVKEWTIKVWDTIVNYLGIAWDWIKDKFNAFLTWISELWNTVWTAIKDFATTVWEGIKNVFITVWNAIWNVISTILAVIYGIIATIFEGIWAFAKWIWSLIGDEIIAVWESVKNAAITIWEAIKTFFSTVWNGIKNVFTTALNICKTVFTTVWNGIKTVATTVWNALKTAATTIFNSIKTVITTVMNVIKSVVTTVWNAIKSFLIPIWNSIKSVASSVWNGISSIISTVVNTIKNVVTSVFNSVKSVITSIWNGIKSIITGVISNIQSKVSSGANFIKSAFTSALNTVKSVFSNLWNAIKAPLDKVVNGIKDKVKKAKEWLTELNPFKRHSPSLVDNVIAGVKVIKDTYKSIGDLQISTPTIGTLSAGRINVDEVFGSGGNGGTGGTTYNAPLVQVENMSVRSDQDVRRLSHELFNLQRNHDRARGGR